jgi:hypothetical protein
MSQKTEPPSRMGRPVTVGATTGLMVKMSAAMRGAIEKRAKAANVTLSEMARRLISLGLKRKG